MKLGITIETTPIEWDFRLRNRNLKYHTLLNLMAVNHGYSTLFFVEYDHTMVQIYSLW